MVSSALAIEVAVVEGLLVLGLVVREACWWWLRRREEA